MKKLNPLPHGLIDYAMAARMIAAPWVLDYHKDKRAKFCSVSTGAAILGLSLLTRYPLGLIRLIPFPVHGAIEATTGALSIAAPWLYGFAGNKRAKWLHVLTGAGTLALVALTKYNASEAELASAWRRREMTEAEYFEREEMEPGREQWRERRPVM